MDPDYGTAGLSPELLVLLFEQAADGMFVTDPQGRLIAVNPRLCDLLGYTSEEALGRPFLDFTDPEDLRANPLRLDELRAGAIVISERPLRSRAGRLIPVEFTTRKLPAGHLLGVARDITERKRAEELLQLSHARLEALWGVFSLSGAGPKDIFDHILASAVRMTRSAYGFYGFVNDDESVMTIHAWSGEAMQDCSLADKPQEFLVSEAGVWGEAIRRRAPLILNDYAAAHEGKKGLPPGHVPLTRLLVVPFFSAGQIQAVVAVANRLTDYSQQDVVQLTSFLNSVDGIAGRARAEEALRESEELLSATQRLSRIGGWEYDVQRQTMAWTDETYRLHDLAPDLSASLPAELVSRSAACYPPEVRGTVLEAFHRCVEQGAPYDLEVPFTSVQGRAMWVRTMAKAVRRGDRIVKVLGTFMDVTERRRMEEDLRESERRFSRVLETMSLIGVMLDTEGRITFCNDFLLNLTGWTREEALGQIWFEIFLPPDVRDEIRNKVFLGTIQAGEVPIHVENEIVTRSGERRLVAWNNTVLRDHAGKVTGTASVGEDITDRKRAEETRLEMERRLLHSQKLESLGVLAGGIAHDFNNLLMAILGNLELGLCELSPVSPARPRLDAASHAARRAADLTRQMLAYSGRGRFMVERVDLNELVQENASLLRSSISRTAALNLHLDPALPAVEADIGQIQQVVMNLITNASEAIGSDPGTITLSTGARDCDGSYLSRNQLEETPPAGRYVYFEVTDNGCGMDEQTQKRMFDPFFTTKFTGRGLGLPAVFGIVRGHGGAILLDSAEGKGTTIRVLFPAVEPAPAAPVPAEGVPAGAAAASPPGTGGGTILVVDDEEMVLQLCTAMVESMGFTVLTAADGEQAVEMVRRHGAEIRAIILDLTMPKLDGAGAFERILLIEPDAKVILSSGYDEAEATGRLAKERLAGFIRKPYHLELLRSALGQALGGAPAADSAAERDR
jgi:two-component system cell cycle sensor histidine kinase/response regulator CckA